ncbi:MAG: tryptophan--tRNA ligase, partial [Bacteroidales bacterium]|nr:tryptophan--tRNA ligase [Bacteroidales bacterium]
PNSQKPEVIQNLFTIMDLVSDKSTIEHFDAAWNDCSIRYGDMKKQLAEDIIKVVTPIRERINDIYNDVDYLEKVARLGAEKARVQAQKTVEEVRQIFGFRPKHY